MSTSIRSASRCRRTRVPAHEAALVGEHEVARPLDADVALGDEALDALGHRCGGEPETLADARLDDALALLLELEDCLQVLLGCGIQVAKIRRG